MQRIKNEQSKPWQLMHICMHELPFSLSGISIVLGETVFLLYECESVVCAYT